MTCNCNDKPFCQCGCDHQCGDRAHELDHHDEFSHLYQDIGGEG